MKLTANQSIGTYIDLFSGCGGFSLGLGNAGWQGVFAVEKDPMAFKTFKHNMLAGGRYEHFSWPSWLPQQATTIQDLIENYAEQLSELRGKVDLIAGGPPCQGFSLAGMRNPNDPRNQLSRQYLKMVDIIRPKFVVLENVRGFNAAFKNSGNESSRIPYSQIVKAKLEELGYNVFHDYLTADKFGVPQQRTRFIMIGIRADQCIAADNPFEKLEEHRRTFLESKGFPNRPITVKEAIKDLEIFNPDSSLVYHSGSQHSGFKKLDYTPPRETSPYLTYVRSGLNGYKPNSLRIARHRESTVEKFKLIQKICRPGIALSDTEKEIIGTRKQAISVLNPEMPSKTLTTLPDDILHYSEPRILTVRESARIQSFPDDFEFQGKYTTGGSQRTQECPRYTQVGNAVPPLLGEALGTLISKLNSEDRNGDSS